MPLPFRLLQVYSLLDKYDDNTPPLDLQASGEQASPAEVLLERGTQPRELCGLDIGHDDINPSVSADHLRRERSDRKNPRFPGPEIKCLSSSCPKICQRTNRLDCDCVDLHVQIEVVHS